MQSRSVNFKSILLVRSHVGFNASLPKARDGEQRDRRDYADNREYGEGRDRDRGDRDRDREQNRGRDQRDREDKRDRDRERDRDNRDRRDKDRRERRDSRDNRSGRDGRRSRSRGRRASVYRFTHSSALLVHHLMLSGYLLHAEHHLTRLQFGFCSSASVRVNMTTG